LVTEENLVVLGRHLADVALVGSGSETDFSQDVIDVGFPEGTSFGMALKDVANGEDHGAVKLDTMPFETPFGTGIIDHAAGRDAGGGGMSACITCIGSKDLHVERGRESHEQSQAWVFDARRAGAGETVELGSSALGAVAAVEGTTSAIGFKFVHPMLAKDNGTGGRGHGGPHISRLAKPSSCWPSALFQMGQAFRLWSLRHVKEPRAHLAGLPLVEERA
jgi:hypothetical protein